MPIVFKKSCITAIPRRKRTYRETTQLPINADIHFENMCICDVKYHQMLWLEYYAKDAKRCYNLANWIIKRLAKYSWNLYKLKKIILLLEDQRRKKSWIVMMFLFMTSSFSPSSPSYNILLINKLSHKSLFLPHQVNQLFHIFMLSTSSPCHQLLHLQEPSYNCYFSYH